MTASIGQQGVSAVRLASGLFAPALAWTVHLLGAVTISEWACLAGWGQAIVLGIALLSWVLIALTLATVLVAAVGVWLAYRAASGQPPWDEPRSAIAHNELFLARVGVWAGAMFLLVILAQSIPILYFLSGC